MGPFDRFNDRAKRVLALAQDEAIRFNHNYIGVEHLLLGLVREGEGVAARVLNSLGVELSKARTAVEFIIGRGDSTTSPSEITLSPRTKRVIELAVDEARKLGHGFVGTEHLLLGIAREGQGVASGVLESLGVSLDQVRHQVIATLGQQQPGMHRVTAASAGVSTPAGAASISFSHATPSVDRFDGGGQRALARAYWEAGRANDREIAPHHLLRGLIAIQDIWVNKILKELGVDVSILTSRIDAASPPSEEPSSPAPLTEAAALNEVIARAASFAAERTRAFIRPEHLLLAIASSPGIAATALDSVGVTQKRIREIIERMDS
jgi:ATP-dependent Clp protease ATP-binding subunit ClpA